MNMDASSKYWMWVAIWSSCMLMMAYSAAFTNDGHVQEDVMSYWETKLHGAVMPTGLHAMVSPLSSNEATQFLINIDAANRQYLPAHAAAFCKTAHIQCAQSGPHSEGSQRHIEKKPNTSPQDTPHLHPLWSYEGTLEKKPKKKAITSPEDAPRLNPLWSYEGSLAKKSTTSSEGAPRLTTLWSYEGSLEKKAQKKAITSPEDAPHLNPLWSYEGSLEKKVTSPEDAPHLNPLWSYEGSIEKKAEDAPLHTHLWSYEGSLEKKAITSLEDVSRVTPLWSYEGSLEKKAITSVEDVPHLNPLWSYEGSLEKKAMTSPENAPLWSYEGSLEKKVTSSEDAPLWSYEDSLEKKAEKKAITSPEDAPRLNPLWSYEGSLEKKAITSPEDAPRLTPLWSYEGSLEKKTEKKAIASTEDSPRLTPLWSYEGSLEKKAITSPKDAPRLTPLWSYEGSPEKKAITSPKDAPHLTPLWSYEGSLEKKAQKKAITSTEDASRHNTLWEYEGSLDKKAITSPEVAPRLTPLWSYEGSLEKKAEKEAITSLEDAPRLNPLWSYEGSLENKVFPQKLETHTLENTKATRLLTSTNVHEFSSTFFREKQILVNGAKVHVKSANENIGMPDRAFLPRKLAKLFPLVGDGTKIASMLGVSEKVVQDTIEACKVKNDKEVRRCLTSIEDLADFAWSIVGAGSKKAIRVYDGIGNASNVKLISNAGNFFDVEDVKVLKADPDEPSMTCHDVAFAFRLFFCHSTKQNKVFEASLRGEDGSVHERIAVCHYDTSYWSPTHTAFAQLHTKPGESEICHWLGTSWMHQNGWAFLRSAI